jgi:site-specific recombinase XerD
MNDFEHYLHQQSFADSTISETIKEVDRFLKWTQSEDMGEARLFTYNDLFGYVSFLKESGIQPQTINIRLCAIRKYYEHLKVAGMVLKNPARHLQFKGITQRITEHPLSYDEMERLYSDYAAYSKMKSYHLRNTAMLGLAIWQAADTHTLAIMEPGHVQAIESLAYLPSSKRSNCRKLRLDARQMLGLHQYLDSLPETQERLFTGNIHNHLTRLVQELQGINPVVRNMQHIRASMLLYWLKLYDKRRVQHMAGHKWISSTELYEQQEISKLDDQLRMHHPFG